MSPEELAELQDRSIDLYRHVRIKTREIDAVELKAEWLMLDVFISHSRHCWLSLTEIETGVEARQKALPKRIDSPLTVKLRLLQAIQSHFIKENQQQLGMYQLDGIGWLRFIHLSQRLVRDCVYEDGNIQTIPGDEHRVLEKHRGMYQNILTETESAIRWIRKNWGRIQDMCTTSESKKTK